MLPSVSFLSLLRKCGLLAAAAMTILAASSINGSHVASAFTVPPAAASSATTGTGGAGLGMGLFDFVSGAFKNEEFDDRRVTASHILVASEDEAVAVRGSLEAGAATFAAAAAASSTCDSAADGGSLGSFGPGTMVREFEDIVFDEATPVGEVVGPIRTERGYHLILVQDRFVNMDRSEGDGFF